MVALRTGVYEYAVRPDAKLLTFLLKRSQDLINASCIVFIAEALALLIVAVLDFYVTLATWLAVAIFAAIVVGNVLVYIRLIYAEKSKDILKVGIHVYSIWHDTLESYREAYILAEDRESLRALEEVAKPGLYYFAASDEVDGTLVETLNFHIIPRSHEAQVKLYASTLLDRLLTEELASNQATGG